MNYRIVKKRQLYYIEQQLSKNEWQPVNAIGYITGGIESPRTYTNTYKAEEAIKNFISKPIYIQ